MFVFGYLNIAGGYTKYHADMQSYIEIACRNRKFCLMFRSACTFHQPNALSTRIMPITSFVEIEITDFNSELVES